MEATYYRRILRLGGLILFLGGLIWLGYLFLAFVQIMNSQANGGDPVFFFNHLTPPMPIWVSFAGLTMFLASFVVGKASTPERWVLRVVGWILTWQSLSGFAPEAPRTFYTPASSLYVAPSQFLNRNSLFLLATGVGLILLSLKPLKRLAPPPKPDGP